MKFGVQILLQLLVALSDAVFTWGAQLNFE